MFGSVKGHGGVMLIQKQSPDIGALLLVPGHFLLVTYACLLNQS